MRRSSSTGNDDTETTLLSADGILIKTLRKRRSESIIGSTYHGMKKALTSAGLGARKKI